MELHAAVVGCAALSPTLHVHLAVDRIHARVLDIAMAVVVRSVVGQQGVFVLKVVD